MRYRVLIAAGALAAPSAHGQIFENQLHTGSARVATDWPVSWNNVADRITGSLTGGNGSAVNWNVGILDPQRLRIYVSGFAGSLGTNNASLTNRMTVT